MYLQQANVMLALGPFLKQGENDMPTAHEFLRKVLSANTVQVHLARSNVLLHS